MTKRDGSEDELLRLRRQMEVLISQAHDGIFITDAQGRVLDANQACTTIMGLPREKLLGQRAEELAKQGYIPDPVVPQVVEKKDKVTRVITYNTGREAIIVCVPIVDTNGEVTRIVCNLRDLTEPGMRQVKLFRPFQEDYSKQLVDLLTQGDKILLDGTVVHSQEMKMVVTRALRAAQIDSNVLITGETGVGKDVIACMIHQNSKRSREGEFVKVDCAAIPEHLLEAELFGYERGAFTDARKEGKPGRIELAHGGTLFLDEVGELPYGLQAKLLNVLQDRRVMRLGGLKSKEVDFRLIAATNRDLEEMVEKGRFRQDLFYRLNIIRIHVPPLRERKDDILALTAHFLRVYGNRYGLRKIASNQVIEYLLEYGWPGNVRELANVIEQLVVMSEGEVITMDDLLQISSFQKRADEINSGSKSPKTLKEALEEYERKLITEALETYPTLREAAESLGIDISTLVRKKAKLNIKTRKSR